MSRGNRFTESGWYADAAKDVLVAATHRRQTDLPKSLNYGLYLLS